MPLEPAHQILRKTVPGIPVGPALAKPPTLDAGRVGTQRKINTGDLQCEC